MLAIVSAYDLKYIELEDAIERISKTLETIQKLQKWNGHLYNWYNTQTLEPLNPRYVSTVDNGNFIGYLYTVKQFLTRESFFLILLANRQDTSEWLFLLLPVMDSQNLTLHQIYATPPNPTSPDDLSQQLTNYFRSSCLSLEVKR